MAEVPGKPTSQVGPPRAGVAGRIVIGGDAGRLLSERDMFGTIFKCVAGCDRISHVRIYPLWGLVQLLSRRAEKHSPNLSLVYTKRAFFLSLYDIVKYPFTFSVIWYKVISNIGFLEQRAGKAGDAPTV
jgi:hypothetical protein